MRFQRKPETQKKSRLLPSTNSLSDSNKTFSSKKEEMNELFYRNFLKDWEICRDRHPGQLEVLRALFDENKKYVFYRAGRKGAKTTTAIDAAWREAHMGSNKVIYLCYPTIAQGIEVVWEERRLQTCDQKDNSMFDKYVEKVDDSRHIVKFSNGSFIKLIGTWTEAKGRGSQPDFLVFDEVQDCNSDYIEAMDANLAAKEFSRCLMMGTPPKKRNHYESWWERITTNSQGKGFHYTSYDNVKLPHLKEWLDNKKAELIKANKEDVWLREYMAELCYSSADRVLPDCEFIEENTIENLVRNFDYASRIPILAISIQPNYLCCVMAILIPRKMMFIVDCLKIPQIWNQKVSDMYEEINKRSKYVQDMCLKKSRNIVWDESGSFINIVNGVTPCRKDPKWQDRGIPLLREMMLNNKIKFSQKVSDFGVECQNLLIEESQKDVNKNYPLTCSLAMMVNEYFSQEKVSIKQSNIFDKYQALRDMGIPAPKKNRVSSFLRFNESV